MHPAYAAPSAFSPVYPNPPPYAWRPYNPSRTYWIIGGIIVVGGAIATAVYLKARKDAQVAVPPTPPEVLEPEPTDGLGTGFGEFPQGAAPAQAEIYYAAARSEIRRLMFLFLDQRATAKDITPGWRAPHHETTGPEFDPGAQPKPGSLGFAPRQPTPDKGPEFWTQQEMFDLATSIMKAFKEFQSYPDIVEWSQIVGQDGPPDAWLKGIITAEAMGLTQAQPEPVNGQVIDWSIFRKP